jgi:dipeptidyl aminopeptidase/acylaminoacyl peptidase
MRLIVAFAALLGPALCWAQLAPQQAISVQRISGVTFAPDGQRIAFTVEGAPKEKSSPRDVWLSDGSPEQAISLTHNGTSFGAQWSPDGRQLAYLSSRHGEPQIYLATLPRGEPVQLTHHGSAVLAFRWSPNGKQIAFLAADPQIVDTAEQDPRVIKIVSGSDVPTRLWVVNTSSQTERSVTSGTLDVSEVSWKNDGEGFIVLASERPDPEHFADRIYAVNGRGMSRLVFDPKNAIEHVELSPDGQTIAYVGPHGEGYTLSDLYVLPVTGGTPKDLTASLDRQVDHYRWKDNSTLVASFEFGFVDHLYMVSRSGKATPLPGFDADPESFDLSRSGDVAFVRETASEPPELFLHKRSGAPSTVITALNSNWSSIPRAKGQLIHYASFDGTQIEGELLRPADAAAGVELPTITLIHGGPVGRWSDRFDPEGQLLASHGYAVFYPNIRGAEGYGQHMIDLIRSVQRGGSGWATGPLKDVLAGVDALVQRGLADPNRLAMGGWSYGGYMTALALSRTDRFKVGVAGAGFYDMVTDLGTEIATYTPGDRWMYGNFFDSQTQSILHDDSPIATVQNIHVPLLLLHGERDPVDTIGQTYEFFRALQTYGVKAELVVYPREGHGLREEAHIIDQLSRTLAWYDAYLKAHQSDLSANKPRR